MDSTERAKTFPLDYAAPVARPNWKRRWVRIGIICVAAGALLYALGCFILFYVLDALKT